MRLQEIEAASSSFKICPKCNSMQGFWVGLKSEHVYVQCKGCGGKFELFEVYPISEKSEAPKRSGFLRK